MRNFRLSTSVAAMGAALLMTSPVLADEVFFDAELTSAAVVPPIRSPASGRIQAELDNLTGEMSLIITADQLSGLVVAVRIRGPAAVGDNAEEVASLVRDLPIPVVAGTFLDPAHFDDLMAGLLYVVVCTRAYPEGEMRAQLVPTHVEIGEGDDD